MQDPFLMRLPTGDDLLEAITRAFRNRSINKAAFTVIGAVRSAVLGFYNPDTRKYQNREFPEDLEIVACVGNVSLKDGEIFVHAHATLSGENYECVGGHLMPGTEIFAAELWAIPIPGEAPARQFDDRTGLALWPQS